jgi:hypothetical protein
MRANVDPATLGMERCVSCDASLSGPYCSRCGERALEPDALTLRHFLVHTVAHELLHVDGTLWRTLRLLFVRPGALSLEYAAGRRRPYVNPFRLLLIAVVVYALMSSFGSGATLNFGPVTLSMAPAPVRQNLSVEGAIDNIDHYGLLRQQLAAKKTVLAGDAARERFHGRLAAFAQPVSFANVVLLAAVLHLCFRWQRRRFLEHAAFSMHVVSFVLLSSVILMLALYFRFWLGGYMVLLMLLIAFAQFAYIAIAIRQFYLRSGRWSGRLLSVAAAILIYLLNSVFMTAVQLAGAAIALALA